MEKQLIWIVVYFPYLWTQHLCSLFCCLKERMSLKLQVYEKQNHEVEKRLWRLYDKVLSWSLFDRSTASSLPETTFEKANGPWSFITIGYLILICLPHLIVLLWMFILEKFSNNNIVNYYFLYEVQGIIGTANDVSTYSFHQGCCTVVVNTAFVCH